MCWYVVVLRDVVSAFASRGVCVCLYVFLFYLFVMLAYSSGRLSIHFSFS